MSGPYNHVQEIVSIRIMASSCVARLLLVLGVRAPAPPPSLKGDTISCLSVIPGRIMLVWLQTARSRMNHSNDGDNSRQLQRNFDWHVNITSPVSSR